MSIPRQFFKNQQSSSGPEVLLTSSLAYFAVLVLSTDHASESLLKSENGTEW